VDVRRAAVDSLRVTSAAPLRERLLRELPSALLVALACAQIGLAFGADLSPWKGGGFGMFATNDHGAFRSVRVFALAGGEARRVEIPPELRRRELRVRELPTARALRGLAEALAGDAPGAEALRAEVWLTEFDAALRPERRKLAEATWRAAR
jgi:hypothetical protein